MDLVYKNEKMLFPIMLAVSLLAWLLLVVFTLGAVLLYLPAMFLFYCFAQSGLVAHLKGNGLRITSEQFPELKQRVAQCCAKLQIANEPDAYLLQMGGVLNAFATRFLGRDFIVLYSDMVDALADRPDALNFHIGHELGHLKRGHLKWKAFLMPASLVPLLGAAYSRAREYTCDRHGLAACVHADDAELGLAALVAGGRLANNVSRPAFIAQTRETSGFWMSFHELTSSYPWLVKRMAALRALAAGHEAQQPRRHAGAVLLALFSPGAGALAGVAFMIGMAAAFGIPAYQAYKEKAAVVQAYAAGRAATARIDKYIDAKHERPLSLAEAGFAGPEAERLAFNADNGELRVDTGLASALGSGVLMFSPAAGTGGTGWRCSARGINPKALPADCR